MMGFIILIIGFFVSWCYADQIYLKFGELGASIYFAVYISILAFLFVANLAKMLGHSEQ